VVSTLVVERAYYVEARICNNGPESASADVEITYLEGLPPARFRTRVLAPGEGASVRTPIFTPTAPAALTIRAVADPVETFDPVLSNNSQSTSRAIYNRPASRLALPPLPLGAGQPGTISGRASSGLIKFGLFGAVSASFDPRLQRVAKVEIAILQGRSTRGSCRWLRNPRARFVRLRATRGRCVTPVWLRATGTTRWTFRLTQGLPAGRYVVMSRATSRAGISEDRFSAADKNRRTFTVRRRAGR
jgi:hypothetical protein